jgi:hypothetical protein
MTTFCPVMPPLILLSGTLLSFCKGNPAVRRLFSIFVPDIEGKLEEEG